MIPAQTLAIALEMFSGRQIDAYATNKAVLFECPASRPVPGCSTADGVSNTSRLRSRRGEIRHWLRPPGSLMRQGPRDWSSGRQRGPGCAASSRRSEMALFESSIRRVRSRRGIHSEHRRLRRHRPIGVTRTLSPTGEGSQAVCVRLRDSEGRPRSIPPEAGGSRDDRSVCAVLSGCSSARKADVGPWCCSRLGLDADWRSSRTISCFQIRKREI